MMTPQKQTDEPGGVGRVEIDHVKEEERRIVLKASAGESFSIQYQADYPASADEYLVSCLVGRGGRGGKGGFVLCVYVCGCPRVLPLSLALCMFNYEIDFLLLSSDGVPSDVHVLPSDVRFVPSHVRCVPPGVRFVPLE